MVFLMISGTLALLFTSQFAYVFLLGIQQVNVHKGYRLRAFLNSFGIGLCQIAALWFIPHARTFTEFAVFFDCRAGRNRRDDDILSCNQKIIVDFVFRV